jgi:hypothetical protein
MIKKRFSLPITEKGVVLFIIAYSVSLLFTVSQMSPLYYTNEWSDVNTYFNLAKAMFNGRPIYAEAFDHKGPVIFFLYGLGYLISQTSFFGMFLIEILAWSVMIYALYKTAKLYISKDVAILYALFCPYFLIHLMEEGGSAEEFILTIQCVSIYLFVRYFKEKEASDHKPIYMFIHMITCTLVFFCKLNLILFWFFPLVGIFLNLLLKKKFVNFGWNVLAGIGGFLVVALPIFLYFYLNDALQEFYAIYIELNRKYAEFRSLGETLETLFFRLSFLYSNPFILFLLFPIGLSYFPLKSIDNRIGKWMLFLSGVVMYASIFSSLTYQVYYPIPLLVFSYLGMLSVFIFISRSISIKKLSLKHLIVIFFLLLFMGSNQKYIYENRITSSVSGMPNLQTKKLHDEIIKEKNPTLVVLSYSLANGLFTTCNIVPNVRFFITPNLPYDTYPLMRDEQTKYIEEKKVQFVVVMKSNSLLETTTLNPISEKFIVRRHLTKEGYNYFMNLPALEENYELCLTDTVMCSNSRYKMGTNEIYMLYKRRD